MTPELRTQAVEAALLAAGRALSVDELVALFEDEAAPPTHRDVRDSIKDLSRLWEGRALELTEVASGFRMQVRASHSHWMTRLWAERAPRYSRALLETLALIAYRQPVTRGQIEDVRGVAVSSSIVRTLLDREWIRVVGHREVPGRPALYGTTRAFLDHFNLRSLEELPALQELRDIEGMVPDLFQGVPAPDAGLPEQSGQAAASDGEGPPMERAADIDGEGASRDPGGQVTPTAFTPENPGDGEVASGSDSERQREGSAGERRVEDEKDATPR